MTLKTKASLHKHARKRAVQRFGLSLNKFTMKELNAAIRNASSRKETVKIIGKQTWSRSRFDVLLNDCWLPVVYDTKRHAIVTVLPAEMLGKL